MTEWSLGDLAWAGDPPQVGDDQAVSRVAVEHRGAYELLGPTGHLEAAVAPAMRDAIEDPIDYPAVGDWVVHTTEARHDRRVLIEKVVPRRSVVVRRAPGHEPVPQVVATNVDELCVVTSPEGDLNIRRLERYLVTALGSGARPVLVLNKVDLLEQRDESGADVGEIEALASSMPDVELVRTSAVSDTGFETFRALLAAGRTLAFTGSSGVGKSTLVNRLLGEELLETGAVRSDGMGRHTTIRRELLVMPGGGVLIDTPGLREIQLWDDGGLLRAFPDIAELATECRFSDCSHGGEPGCAVAAAVDAGRLVAARVTSFRDLAAELDVLADEREEHDRLLRRRRDARRRSGRRA